MAGPQYVYVMKDLTKAYPGGREVFKGITLSFLPGVKIGVLGVNGAGKSTLLRIMAGKDKEFGGEAWAADGIRIGYLEQEPQLDETKTVGENVAEGFGPLKKAVDRFNEISMKFAEPMDDDTMNALLAEQADLQEKIDAGNGWNLIVKLKLPLMRYVVHQLMQESINYQEVSDVVLLCVVCCWKNRIFFYWMSRQIILMRKVLHG